MGRMVCSAAPGASAGRRRSRRDLGAGSARRIGQPAAGPRREGVTSLPGRRPGRGGRTRRRRVHPLATGVLLALLLAAGLAGAAEARRELRFSSRALDVEAPVLKSFAQDLQGDGLVDLLFLTEDGRFIVGLQERGGAFTLGEFPFPLPPGTDSLDVADADGDGTPDICLTLGSRVLRCHGSAGRAGLWARLLVGLPLAEAAAQTDRALEEEAAAPAGLADLPLADSLHRSPDLMWDLDGDGREDLFLPRFTGLEVWLNPGAGPGEERAAPFALAQRTTYPSPPLVSLGPRRIRLDQPLPAVADVDADGRPEIVFFPETRAGSARMELSWLGMPAGTDRLQAFRHSIPAAPGESATEALLADFSGDGRLDVALLTTRFRLEMAEGGEGGAGGGGGLFEEKRLKVFLTGAEDGLLAGEPLLDLSSGANLWQDVLLRHDDLDSDGRRDLALFYYKGLMDAKLVIECYRGLGGGRFANKPSRQVLEFPDAQQEVIHPDADFDGDGEKDLLLLAAGQVQIFLRRPPGDRRRAEEPFFSRPAVRLDPAAGREPAGKGKAVGEEEEAEVTVTLSLGGAEGGVSWQTNELAGVDIRDLDGDGRADVLLARRPPWDEAARGRPPVLLTVYRQQ